MKRNSLTLALIAGTLLAVGQPTTRVVDAPHKRPPGIRRYKAIERVDRTKQHDQQAKLERRAARASRDEQMFARQKAKWG